MEKRALLAFVLSMAVIVAWEFFMTPQHPRQQHPVKPQQVQQKAVEKRASTKTTTKTVAKPAAPAKLPAQEAAPVKNYKTWKIEGPLFVAEVAGAGARLEHFRLKKHRTRVEAGSPPMEMVSSYKTGYLPLALDLLQHPGWQLATRPYESRKPSHIELKADGNSQAIAWSTQVPGHIRVTKNLVFSRSNYTVDVEVALTNLDAAPLEDQLGISFYFQPYDDGQQGSSYNASKLAVYRDKSLATFNTKKIIKKRPVFQAPLDWAGYENNYFIQAFVPLDEDNFQIVPKVVDPKGGLVRMVFLSEPFRLEGGQRKSFKMRLYLGPKEAAFLKAADHHLANSIDFGWFTFLAKPLLQVLKWIYRYTHNYGIAIIILTILIKILFWPLTHKSYKSMQGMKKLQPKMAEIKEKYKDDRDKLNQELMMLYRTYKVNPLGGCLPMVLQIPVFFALYRMLYAAIELRHQPFCLWINDLTAPDRLNIGVHIPYLGGLPVLTLLMGVSMFIQQKMTPSTGDPRQEKMMLMMPVVFTVFFINFPSGLVLYWLVNNILSIVQQYMINRQTA